MIVTILGTGCGLVLISKCCISLKMKDGANVAHSPLKMKDGAHVAYSPLEMPDGA